MKCFSILLLPLLIIHFIRAVLSVRDVFRVLFVSLSRLPAGDWTFEFLRPVWYCLLREGSNVLVSSHLISFHFKSFPCYHSLFNF